MRLALAAPRRASRARPCECHRGVVVKMSGDGVHAVFDDPLDAVERGAGDAAGARAIPRPPAVSRCACAAGCTPGPAERRDNDFFGSAVNRAARICQCRARRPDPAVAGRGGAGRDGRLPAGVTLRDLGAVRLRDLASPERIYQVLHPNLRETFPALRTLEATPNNLRAAADVLRGAQARAGRGPRAAAQHPAADAVRRRRHRQDAPVAAAGGRRAGRFSRRRLVRGAGAAVRPAARAAVRRVGAGCQGRSRPPGCRGARSSSSRTGGCSSSSTIASIWYRPAPSSPRSCCSPDRISRSWRRAANRCASRAKRPIRFRRSRFRTRESPSRRRR